MSLGPSPAQEAWRSRSSREGTLDSQRARACAPARGQRSASPVYARDGEARPFSETIMLCQSHRDVQIRR